jgi:hypothetical protein
MLKDKVRRTYSRDLLAIQAVEKAGTKRYINLDYENRSLFSIIFMVKTLLM